MVLTILRLAAASEIRQSLIRGGGLPGSRGSYRLSQRQCRLKQSCRPMIRS